MITDVCGVCRERIESEDGLLNWRHGHGAAECGTGDGATAVPSDPAWLERMAAAHPNTDLSAYR